MNINDGTVSEPGITKCCSLCKNIKPLGDFHKSTRDGVQSTCKVCRAELNKSEKSRRYQAGYKNKSKYKCSREAYRRSDVGKLVNTKSQANYRANNPIKIRALQKVYSATKAGVLTVPNSCEECGNSGRPEGHHDDYSLPLVVRWLCRPCHIAWHDENGAGLNG